MLQLVHKGMERYNRIVLQFMNNVIENEGKEMKILKDFCASCFNLMMNIFLCYQFVASGWILILQENKERQWGQYYVEDI